MHRLMLVSMILATVSPAAAEPSGRDACQVTIARAPDHVRLVIEKWVRAEPACDTTLELRIVPTDGGLYLLAREPNGRVRERIVPDAETAGVLVASWIARQTEPQDMAVTLSWMPPSSSRVPAQTAASAAADLAVDLAWTPSPPAPSPAPTDDIAVELMWTPAARQTHPVSPPSQPTPVPAIETASAHTPHAARSTATRVHAPGDVYETAAVARTRPERRIDASGVLGRDVAGVRAGLDVASHGAWALGVAASITTETLDDVRGWRSWGYLDTIDTKLVAYVAHTARFGKLALRGTLGGGFIHTAAHGTLYDDDPATNYAATYWPQATALSPTLEASLVLSRSLSDHWSGFIGPIATAYAQDLTLKMGEANLPYVSQHARRYLDVAFAIGAAYRL